MVGENAKIGFVKSLIGVLFLAACIFLPIITRAAVEFIPYSDNGVRFRAPQYIYDNYPYPQIDGSSYTWYVSTTEGWWEWDRDACLEYSNYFSPARDCTYILKAPNGETVAFATLYDANTQTFYSPVNTKTRVTRLEPLAGTLIATGTPVTFITEAFISPDDLSATFTTYKIEVMYKSANVTGILDGGTTLFYGAATTSNFYYSTTTTALAAGNYYVEAHIIPTYLGGLVQNPFTGTRDRDLDATHCFVIGVETWIGGWNCNVSQRIDEEIAKKATSTVDVDLDSCNPLGGFDILRCLVVLLIPDKQAIKNVAENAREDILTRFPLGYAQRFVDILGTTPTTTLTSFTVHLASASSSPLYGETLTFDMQDTLTGGYNLIESVKDPYTGKSMKDILYPYIQIFVALSVLFIIVRDMTGVHKHK